MSRMLLTQFCKIPDFQKVELREKLNIFRAFRSGSRFKTIVGGTGSNMERIADDQGFSWSCRISTLRLNRP
jgi:hypothetical protein